MDCSFFEQILYVYQDWHCRSKKVVEIQISSLDLTSRHTVPVLRVQSRGSKGTVLGTKKGAVLCEVRSVIC